jgi:Eco57I restriction-modification methylase
MPNARALVTSGSDLDLSSRDGLVASLHGASELKLVAEVEVLARRPDLRFFHWEIEFPEVFTGFFDPNQTKIMHKDRIKKGSAGFDVVIGNPPYVRQEVLKPLKSYLKSRFQTFDSTNDLYVYFQEIEIHSLRVGGRMGMIVANKWMRAGYGERVRDFLQRSGQPLEVIDFGHSPIFPDADTFPCILLMAKRPRPLAEQERPSDAEAMAVCEVPREHWHDRLDLQAFVSRQRHRIPTRLLRKEGWSLEDPRIQTLFDRIRASFPQLSSVVGTSPLMGIKTGFNEGFVVDEHVARRLIAQSASSRELLRPLIRGRDADRWLLKSSGVMLIHIPSSENSQWPWSNMAEAKARKVFRDTFPAIYDYMSAFEDELKRRQDQGRFWWELRSCAYYDKLTKPKLIIQSIAYHSFFCRAASNEMPNNSLFFVPIDDPRILAILNSPLAWSYMYRNFPHKKDEAIAMDSAVVATLPVPPRCSNEEATSLSERLLASVACRREWEASVLQAAAKQFDAAQNTSRILQWLAQPNDVFASRVLGSHSGPRVSKAVLDKLSLFRADSRARQVELLSNQLQLEMKLAVAVEDAYGLTPEERSLLWSTRPIRDPLSVLEAKIRGNGDEDEGSAIDE